jgi:PIN domain nuclease of toxin-antitoxin system
VRVLLDTQALIYAIDEPARLGPQAVALLRIKSTDVLISAATVWELAIKCGLGKLKLTQPYRPWIDKAILDLGAQLLPINVEYSAAQLFLPLHHRDPFDRILAAQAIVEGVAIVSGDAVFDRYGVSRAW